MRKWLAALAAGLALAGTEAMAESWQKKPLVTGDPELFGMVDMTEGRCSLQLEDLEKNYVPEIKLQSTKVRAGRNFVDGVYLTSWSFDRPGARSALISIQVFKGDRGRYAIAVSPELSYAGGAVKSANFLAIFRPGATVAVFKERLASNNRSDRNFAAVAQPVEVKGGTVSFTRTTETKLKISVSCRF